MAKSHSDWPSRELSCGTPVLCKQGRTRDWGIGGAQHAIQHTKPHPGQCRTAPVLGLGPSCGFVWRVAGTPGLPGRRLQQGNLSDVDNIVEGLLNNNPTAAAGAIANAANSGNQAAITSAISFAGLAVSLYGHCGTTLSQAFAAICL